MNTFKNLSIGHRLPNGWTVESYCVTDRHGIVLATSTNRTTNETSYATWTVSNNDLRSTAQGRYLQEDRKAAYADFKTRCMAMPTRS